MNNIPTIAEITCFIISFFLNILSGVNWLTEYRLKDSQYYKYYQTTKEGCQVISARTNQWLWPLKLWGPTHSWGILDITLCDKVCQCPRVTWSSTLVFSINKTDHHDITQIILKVVLST
jgi:hypothetical protein